MQALNQVKKKKLKPYSKNEKVKQINYTWHGYY